MKKLLPIIMVLALFASFCGCSPVQVAALDEPCIVYADGPLETAAQMLAETSHVIRARVASVQEYDMALGSGNSNIGKYVSLVTVDVVELLRSADGGDAFSAGSQISFVYPDSSHSRIDTTVVPIVGAEYVYFLSETPKGAIRGNGSQKLSPYYIGNAQTRVINVYGDDAQYHFSLDLHLDGEVEAERSIASGSERCCSASYEALCEWLAAQ